MAIDVVTFQDAATGTGAGTVHAFEGEMQRMCFFFEISGGTPTIQLQISDASDGTFNTIYTVNAAAPTPIEVTALGYWRANISVTGGATTTVKGVRETKNVGD